MDMNAAPIIGVNERGDNLCEVVKINELAAKSITFDAQLIPVARSWRCRAFPSLKSE